MKKNRRTRKMADRLVADALDTKRRLSGKLKVERLWSDYLNGCTFPWNKANPKPMKYVRQFGSIWELSEQKFKELLEAGAKAKSYNLNDYGRMIIDTDDIIEPLDWSHSDFKSKLQDYLQTKKIEKAKARVDRYFNGTSGLTSSNSKAQWMGHQWANQYYKLEQLTSNLISGVPVSRSCPICHSILSHRFS
jgi:hypothetical protein